MSNTLTYFQATGAWRDVENPLPSTAGSTTPQIDDISGYVDFYPGIESEALTSGLALYVSDYETYGDTELVIAPITGRIYNAKLSSITVNDPEGVGLVANSSWLDFGEPIFYHTRFYNVTYNGAQWHLENFAFQALPGAGTVRLTSPVLQRFPYKGP